MQIILFHLHPISSMLVIIFIIPSFTIRQKFQIVFTSADAGLSLRLPFQTKTFSVPQTVFTIDYLYRESRTDFMDPLLFSRFFPDVFCFRLLVSLTLVIGVVRQSGQCKLTVCQFFSAR